MLYRSTDRLSRFGAPAGSLAHRASFQQAVNNAPSKPGIKHLKICVEGDRRQQAGTAPPVLASQRSQI